MNIHCHINKDHEIQEKLIASKNFQFYSIIFYNFSRLKENKFKGQQNSAYFTATFSTENIADLLLMPKLLYIFKEHYLLLKNI